MTAGRCANVPAGGTRGRPCKLCMLHRFLGREGLRVWGLRVHSAGFVGMPPAFSSFSPFPPSSFPSVLVRSIYSCLSPSSFPCRRRSLLASLSLSLPPSPSISLCLFVSLLFTVPRLRFSTAIPGGSFVHKGPSPNLSHVRFAVSACLQVILGLNYCLYVLGVPYYK